jgi:hypothetical protein
MAKYTYRCPACQEKFTISLREEPRFCPLCGYDTAEDARREEERHALMLATQQPPHYKNAVITAAVDGTYNGMVAAADKRVEAAAAAAGCDASEMSMLKMTDMKDNLRTGDIAHVVSQEARAAASRLDMDFSNPNVGATRQPEVINFARAGTASGPLPRAGLGMLQRTQQQFFHRTPEHIARRD